MRSPVRSQKCDVTSDEMPIPLVDGEHAEAIKRPYTPLHNLPPRTQRFTKSKLSPHQGLIPIDPALQFPLDEPQVEEPRMEEPHAGEPRMEEPYADEPHVEEPYAEKPHAQEPYVEEPYAEEPHVEKPHAQEPYAQEPHEKDETPMDPHEEDETPMEDEPLSDDDIDIRDIDDENAIDEPVQDGSNMTPDVMTPTAPSPMWVNSSNWPVRLSRLVRIERDASIGDLIEMMLSAGLVVPRASRPTWYLKSHFQAYLDAAIAIATQKAQTYEVGLQDSSTSDSFTATIAAIVEPLPLPSRARKRPSRVLPAAGTVHNYTV